mmetsp:Transcript_410/g.646  ORF Transcript_410/g.646 Transcript_410/m.646 type:complete len:215 (+) Transcript_410:30-674(+)
MTERVPYASTSAATAQLFARLRTELDESKPNNVINYCVDFLCQHYPEHLHGFAEVWKADPEFERERQLVLDFFKAHKISSDVANHFINAGYDTLDSLTTLTVDSLVDIEAFSEAKWLPGHKIRLQQVFQDITSRVRAFQQQINYGQPQFRQANVASAPQYAAPAAGSMLGSIQRQPAIAAPVSYAAPTVPMRMPYTGSASRPIPATVVPSYAVR